MSRLLGLQGLRLTERGEFVADCLALASILITLASFGAIMTMMGMN
jgi:hypothetical protein